jgi:peptide/nickel transport system substrate-binding protein
MKIVSNLVFQPHVALSSLQPHLDHSYVCRNASFLVWDTLYGVDRQLMPGRQMIFSEQASRDRTRWEFALRPGLLFHTGEPVRATDAVSSIELWLDIDPVGRALRAATRELSVIDDRNFRWKFSRPVARLTALLSKITPPCLFVMPASSAIAARSGKRIEPIGSGPMCLKTCGFDRNEATVFKAFDRYEPREEPADFLTGGKRAVAHECIWRCNRGQDDTIEAMIKGQLDWSEHIDPSMTDRLAADPFIECEEADPFGFIGICRFNHLAPPFDDLHARSYVADCIPQERCMASFVDVGRGRWRQERSCLPFLVDGQTDGAAEPQAVHIDRPPAPLSSTPTTIIVAADQHHTTPQGVATASWFAELGLPVQVVKLTSQQVQLRRHMFEGWNIFHTWFSVADFTVPSAFLPLRASGRSSWSGWPTNEALEIAHDCWIFSNSDAEADKAADVIRGIANEFRPFAPTGRFWPLSARRRHLAHLARHAVPVFWS